MPIYEYRCSSCGVQQDVMQKISDPVLTACPACGANSFVKQLTAAVGSPTLRLIRYAIGDWTLDGLASGEWREQQVANV